MGRPGSGARRPRLRELGVRIGRYAPGPFNAITDVTGVRVGHTTLIEGDGPLSVGEGPVRSGVTAILPNDGNIFMDRMIAGGFVLNGAGEVSGLTQVMEWGLLETPILLTNTLSVGRVGVATVQYMIERYPGIGDEHDVIIPVVGECDDSYLNDIAGDHVRRDHVFRALDGALSGPVAEGSVGGGTGMVTCDLKAGIGTSSRVLAEAEGAYTVGVLVMSNFGRLEDLRVDGIRVGDAIHQHLGELPRRRTRIDGSIIAVVATNAPLDSAQIGRLCKRVGLGIGRTGSYAAHGSGEIVVGFSTANIVPREPTSHHYQLTLLADRWIDPLYRATVDCTEEAILNALCAAEAMDGVNGNRAAALPTERVAEIWAARQLEEQPRES